MKILGIETAVDESAAAVVEDGYRVLSSVVSSQAEIHQKYGGVVPELAARNHVATIIPTIDLALAKAHTKLSDIDCMAVCTTPGLVTALLVGIETARTFGCVMQKPIIAINDLESHAFACWLEDEELFRKTQRKENWPMIYLIVSGGTTQLFLANYFGEFRSLGQTLDDAVGEAFDKVAKMLNLGYPGGPIIEKTALKGNVEAYKFPRPMLHSKDLNFSFSGLKTAVLYKIKELQKISSRQIADLAASFQQAAIDVLVKKTLQAADEYRVKAIAVGGGVAANNFLRNNFQQKSRVPVYFPLKKYCTDNAAMLAGCAYYYAQKKIFTPLDKIKPFCYQNIKGKTIDNST